MRWGCFTTLFRTHRYLSLIHISKDDLNLPDCHLFLYDQLVAFDHLSNKTVIIQNISRLGDAETAYTACAAEAEQLGSYLTEFSPLPHADVYKRQSSIRPNARSTARQTSSGCTGLNSNTVERLRIALYTRCV